MSPIPDNVIDKQLYSAIKRRIHKGLDKENKRWGAYASSRLVREYKERGGRYSDTLKKEKKNGLDRWFKELWINICESDPPGKLVKCGRRSSSLKYPVCRPYYRITDETPLTYSQMKKDDIEQICKSKNKNPLMILPKFTKK